MMKITTLTATINSLIVDGKALLDQMVALTTTTMILKVDDIINNNIINNNNINNPNKQENQFWLLGFVITTLLLLCTENQNIPANLIWNTMSVDITTS